MVLKVGGLYYARMHPCRPESNARGFFNRSLLGLTLAGAARCYNACWRFGRNLLHECWVRDKN